MQEYQGTVKWYNPDKAFGFITGGPTGDIFVHKSNIDKSREELIEGQEVMFRSRQGNRGLEAYDVRVTKETDNPPRPRTSNPRIDRPGGRGFSTPGFSGGGGRSMNFRDGNDSAPRRRPSADVDYSNIDLPSGPISGVVVSKDMDDRFLFVQSERDNWDIFVHGSLYKHMSSDIRQGDKVRVRVESGPKGLRAVSLDL
jgi:cold shock protein